MLEYTRVGPRRARQLLSRCLTSGPKRSSQRLGFPDGFNERRQIANDALSGGVGSVIVADADRCGRRAQEEAPAGRCWWLNQK